MAIRVAEQSGSSERDAVRGSGRVILVFSQVYLPDAAAVGQYLADVTTELARRGHRVRVYTANRGYDDPSVRYPSREVLGGVEVRRLPLSSFGKGALAGRALAMVLFTLQCLLAGLFTRRLGGIVFSTTPPLIGFAALLIRWIRGVPIGYWVMDLNPDQMIAMGHLSPGSPVGRALERLNGAALRSSGLVIALDRFMAERIASKTPLRARLLVIPPWPQEDHVEPVEHDANPFRQLHGFQDRFVVMYSGNHTPCNPLDTLLEAVRRLRHDERIRFAFVGGGTGKREVEEFVRRHDLRNVVLLPYQPLSEVRYSLSAADVHVVSLGDEMVGIIHPSKTYAAMAASKPILFFGPRPSYMTDLLEQRDIGRRVPHGDVEGAVEAIRELATLPPDCRSAMGRRAQELLRGELAQGVLCTRLCDELEAAFAMRRRIVRHRVGKPAGVAAGFPE